ncbi:MAG: hypothetical protein KBT66_05605 [Amphritea sp.]|nr:hypothetical protein [Amphritea sp.]MBQ0783693.1 hypothetical protein [Amphritea sp.]
MNRHNLFNSCSLTLCSLLILLSGCTSQQHSMKLGDSVNQLVSQQTLNPDAAVKNGTALKSDLDGQIGENILQTYRTSTGEPKAVQKEIKISIGN